MGRSSSWRRVTAVPDSGESPPGQLAPTPPAPGWPVNFVCPWRFNTLAQSQPHRSVRHVPPSAAPASKTAPRDRRHSVAEPGQQRGAAIHARPCARLGGCRGVHARHLPSLPDRIRLREWQECHNQIGSCHETSSGRGCEYRPDSETPGGHSGKEVPDLQWLAPRQAPAPGSPSCSARTLLEGMQNVARARGSGGETGRPLSTAVPRSGRRCSTPFPRRRRTMCRSRAA